MSNPLGVLSEDSFNSKMTDISNKLTTINSSLESISNNKILRPGNVTLSTNTVTLTYSRPTATVKLSNITGEPSLTVIGDYFNATLENGTITITKTDIWSETGTILVTISGNGIYASTVTMITVIVDDVEIGTWSNGTDKQINSMLKAAHRGDLNLTDYWSVGDERIVNNLDTSTITSETLTLKLGTGIQYYTDSSGNNTTTSIFKILVNQNRYESAYYHFYTSSSGDYRLSFSEATDISNSLPSYIKNNLIYYYTQLKTTNTYGNSNTNYYGSYYTYGGTYLTEISHNYGSSYLYISNETYTSSSRVYVYAKYQSSSSNSTISNSSVNIDRDKTNLYIISMMLI